MMKNLIWFRNDLRVLDNPALYNSCISSEQVIAVYFISEGQWNLHDESLCKINFWIRNLQILQEKLDNLNIPLVVIEASFYRDIQREIIKLVEEEKITSVFFNNEYGFNELKRDRDIYICLKSRNIEVFHFHDQVIHNPGSLKTLAGQNFKVYSPFKRSWFKNLSEEQLKIISIPKKKLRLRLNSTPLKKYLLKYKSHVDPNFWPAGEDYACNLVDVFLSNKAKSYKLDRDFPAINGTSKISPYLNSGVVSAKWCLNKAKNYNQMKLDEGNSGIVHWVSEILWREFYRHIIYNFPQVSKNKPFIDKTKNIKWNQNKDHLEKWKTGKTGIPIVDAAMRQLNETGWMHNRLRMITAMFLSKNLLINWQEGEKYFMQNLIDGDIASNNGGWQWSASTGTDAAPYFRIMNPISQSKRFDPDGVFIKKWVRELENCSVKDIHEPNKPDSYGYNKPIVDLKKTRAFAIEVFKNLKE